MTAQQLKNSILQLAVQGKLVPQDPSDEPARVLLERIRKEKETLIKAKKIKKEKTPSVIFRGADNTPYEKIGNEVVPLDVPFDIPDSWEWVRLSELFAILNGDRGKNYPSKDKLKPTGIPFISAINLDGKTVIEDDRLLCLSESQYDLLNNGKLMKDDIVVCIRGSLGKHGRFPFEKGAIASSLVIMRPYLNINILCEYLMLYLDAPLFFTEIKKYDNGTAQPNLAAKSLECFLFPLPPLEEQYRIIAKIAEFLPLFDSYASAEGAINHLNTTFPQELKKSILQWAVQGKLVPQDENDEPAEVLLERIKAEKEALIKAGKIKRDKNESVIFRRDNSHYEKRGSEIVCIDDEIPFDIPTDWGWIRLGGIGEWGSGATPSRGNPEYYNGEIPWLKTGDLTDGYITEIPESISEEALKNTSVKLNPAGSILMAMYGATIGKLGILTYPATTNQACCACKPVTGIEPLYLFYYLMSQRKAFIKRGEGGAQPNISKEKIVSTLMPVPPLAEQHRIVAKIEELIPLIKVL